MKKKDRLRVVLVNLGLFLALFGLVTLNKIWLRPRVADSEFGQALAGSLPNFLAGLFIGLAIVNPVLVRKPDSGRKRALWGIVLLFGVLALEEFVPLWGASTCFDWYDVLASGLGCLGAFVFFRIVEGRNSELRQEN